VVFVKFFLEKTVFFQKTPIRGDITSRNFSKIIAGLGDFIKEFLLLFVKFFLSNTVKYYISPVNSCQRLFLM